MKSAKIADYIGFSIFWLTVQLIGMLPFWIIYGISFLFYLLVYYVVPFRRKIAIQNLNNSFPDYTHKQIKAIYKKHVRFMCDMALETLKGFTMSYAAMCKRWVVTNPELMDQYQNQSVIAISAHYANWEWGISMEPQIKHRSADVYKPVRNPLLDRYMLRAREKMGMAIVPVKSTARYFLTHRAEAHCYFLVADQHPGGTSKVHWMKFLGQDTAFIVGPEKYAKSFNYPVVFTEILCIKRGYYQARFIPITDDPLHTADGEITEKSMHILEKQIKQDPAYWLWGHKRWKLKR